MPSNKRLFIAWFALMGLTAASMFSGRADQQDATSLGLVWMAVLLATTLLKCREILFVYLNLQISSTGWKAFFMTFLTFVLAGVYGTYAFTL